jgi:hypothetical protein
VCVAWIKVFLNLRVASCDGDDGKENVLYSTISARNQLQAGWSHLPCYLNLINTMRIVSGNPGSPIFLDDQRLCREFICYSASINDLLPSAVNKGNSCRVGTILTFSSTIGAWWLNCGLIKKVGDEKLSDMHVQISHSTPKTICALTSFRKKREHRPKLGDIIFRKS